MKTKSFLQTVVPLALLSAGSAHATVTFYSDFTEASLGAITGLNIDTPSTSGADSGTVTLNDANDQLDFTANSADLWTTRQGAPIAWVSAPTVSVGQTWYVETQLNMVNDTGTNKATYDQAGITFYGGPDGANPGLTNGSSSFAMLLSDWGVWAASQAVLGTGGTGNSEAANLTAADTNIFLRVEITANATDDTYNFFYKENVGDAWSQLGADAEDKTGTFDNSRVGLVTKSHNDNAAGAAQFDYFEVGIVPEPSTTALLGLGGLALILRRRK